MGNLIALVLRLPNIPNTYEKQTLPHIKLILNFFFNRERVYVTVALLYVRACLQTTLCAKKK